MEEDVGIAPGYRFGSVGAGSVNTDNYFIHKAFDRFYCSL